jgi:hypothetical protein
MLLDKKEIMRRSASNITTVLIDAINDMAEEIELLMKRVTVLEEKPNGKAKGTVAGTTTKPK